MGIKYSRHGLLYYEARIKVLLKTPPFATLEGMQVRSLLSGYYEVIVNIQEDKLNVLKKRAEKIESLLKRGLL